MPAIAEKRRAMLDSTETSVGLWRQQLKAMRAAKPMITFYRNKDDGSPGLEYYGRVDYRDTLRASFPFKKNVSAQGVMELRFDHYIAEWLRTIPNDPVAKKNIIIRVDMFGGRLRWTGLLHHHATKKREDGTRYMEVTFNDDLQFLQFLLGPPNPVLPLGVFQWPRVLPILGPSKWACSILVLINLIRVEGNLWQLPDDPFSPEGWDDLIDWKDWQVHIKCNPLPPDDSSLWTVLGTRMNPIDSVLGDALEDAQLTMRWRRIFTDEGETESGVLFVGADKLANGALVYELVDDSGYYGPFGTFLNGTIANGFFRSAVWYVGGLVEDTGKFLVDDETIYNDEYYGPGFLGTLAQAPWVVIRDSAYSPLDTSELTWSPATAVRAVVGGDNPAADAIARLIIETAGNMIGYFLLGGFSSAGSIAADAIMPFLVGTIAAWVEWKHNHRATQLGWVHLWELYQQGAENNAWSLSALAALRGAFMASRSETSHQLTVNSNSWVIPGVHFHIGSRVGSTCRGYPSNIFIAQCEEIVPQWDHTGDGVLDFDIKIGQAKASMGVGERVARATKRAIDLINNLGVHLIS